MFLGGRAKILFMQILMWIVGIWLGVGAIFAAISYGDIPGSKWAGVLIVMLGWPLAMVPWEKMGLD